MRLIIAKFDSTCAETGVKLKKGDTIIYDSDTKKAYSLTSNTAKKNQDEAECKSTADYIQAQEEAYFNRY